MEHVSTGMSAGLEHDDLFCSWLRDILLEKWHEIANSTISQIPTLIILLDQYCGCYLNVSTVCPYVASLELIQDHISAWSVFIKPLQWVVCGSIVQHNSYVILNVVFVTTSEHAATLTLSNIYTTKVGYFFINGKSYITQAQRCH